MSYFMRTSEYNRSVKKKYNFFCCLDCSQLYRKQNPDKYFNNLREWNKSDKSKEHLKKLNEEKSIKTAPNAPYKYFLTRIRARVKKCNFENTLDLSTLKSIWEKQKGICPYTGWKLKLPNKKNKKTYDMASIDRIDSDKGYTADNIRFVSIMVNYGKNDFKESEMIDFCKAITKKHKDLFKK